MDVKSSVPERYVVKRDVSMDIWRIFDAHHPSVSNIVDINLELGDDSPAIKIITGGEAAALISEMKREGIFENLVKEPKQIVYEKNKRLTKEDIAISAISNIKQVALGFGLGENIADLGGKNRE